MTLEDHGVAKENQQKLQIWLLIKLKLQVRFLNAFIIETITYFSIQRKIESDFKKEISCMNLN